MAKIIEEAKVVEKTRVVKDARAVIRSTRSVIQSMITLASAALGLVCALAWNDAIKTAMRKLLGDDQSMTGSLPTQCLPHYWRWLCYSFSAKWRDVSVVKR